jgi:hypothetical protein
VEFKPKPRAFCSLEQEPTVFVITYNVPIRNLDGYIIEDAIMYTRNTITEKSLKLKDMETHEEVEIEVPDELMNLDVFSGSFQCTIQFVTF